MALPLKEEKSVSSSAISGTIGDDKLIREIENRNGKSTQKENKNTQTNNRKLPKGIGYEDMNQASDAETAESCTTDDLDAMVEANRDVSS